VRLRPFTTLAVCLLLTGVLPAVAMADIAPASTLHVARVSGCSDSGTGTTAQPYCTIQAAANAVLPGQTVAVGSLPDGQFYDEDVHITRSGTPAEPITFTTESPWRDGTASVVLNGDVIATHGFELSGVHDVTISGFGLAPTRQGTVVVAGSTDVTLDHLVVSGSFVPGGESDGIDITGASAHVTVTGSTVSALGTAVSVGTGASATTLSDDIVEVGSSGFAVTGADNTVITNDTMVNNDINSPVSDCVDSPLVVDDSTGTSIENDVFAQPCSGVPVSVSTDSAPTTTLDYNVASVPSGFPAYSWADTRYDTAATLLAATGQGAHDSNADPHLDAHFVPADDSPAVDSADATAPATPATDFAGNARVDDPLVANTGTGTGIVDRGAVERVDPVSATLTLSASKAPTGSPVTASITASSPWAPITGYTVDFGDEVVHSTATTLHHTYTVTGDQQVTVTATDSLGDTSAPGAPVALDVVAPTPFVPVVTATPSGALGVQVTTTASTDGWNITSTTCDFGDGSGAGQSCDAGHTYALPGAHVITVAETDAGGSTATGSTSFTSAGSDFVRYGPTRLLDTRKGTGTGGTVAKVAAGATLRLPIVGNGAIPSGIAAVVLTVTVVGNTAPGYVTVYPDGAARPAVSNLNFVPGHVVPATTIVAPGADGYVDIFVHGSATDVIADTSGYFVHKAVATQFSPESMRVVDTRTGQGTNPGSNLNDPLGPIRPLAAGATMPFDVGDYLVRGTEGVDLAGVVLNVTVTNPTADGYLTVYPDDSARPITSNVNFVRGQTTSNLVIMPTGLGSGVKFYNGSPGTVDLVVDLEGYFDPVGSATFVPVTPRRAFDTRQSSPIPREWSVQERIGTDGPGVADVVLNATVTDTGKAGYLAVSSNPEFPTTSNVNWAQGQTVANLTVTPFPAVDLDNLSFYNGSDGTTDVLGDVVGFFGQP
jgi:hypothetical protein